MRADRLVSLMLLLQDERRHTAEELSRRLEVSPRTIYRDLDALSSAGVPVYAQPGSSGGISLLPGWRTHLTGLTEPEIQALASAHPIEALDDLGLADPLRTGLVKLAAALPGVQRTAAEHARQRLHIDGSSWFGEKDPVPHLSVLREAVFQDRKVRLAYRDFEGARSTRVVNPYGLVIKGDHWYLVADDNGTTKVFRGSRVEGARTLTESFVRPAEFELRSFWKDWCKRFASQRARFEVTVRLTPEGAEALSTMRPASDQERIRSARTEADGTRTVTIDFERISIALSQLVMLGRGAEVLEPQELRTRLGELASDLTALYGTGDGRAIRRKRRTGTSPLTPFPRSG